MITIINYIIFPNCTFIEINVLCQSFKINFMTYYNKLKIKVKNPNLLFKSFIYSNSLKDEMFSFIDVFI